MDKLKKNGFFSPLQEFPVQRFVNIGILRKKALKFNVYTAQAWGHLKTPSWAPLPQILW